MSDISKHLGDERRLKLSIDKIKEVISKSTPVVNWYAHTEDKTVRGPFGRWFTASGEDKHLANINNDVEYCAMAMTILPEMVEEIQQLKQQLESMTNERNELRSIKELCLWSNQILEINKLNEQLKDAVEVIEEIKDICDKKFLLNINYDQFTSLRRYSGRVNEFLAKYRGEK